MFFGRTFLCVLLGLCNIPFGKPAHSGKPALDLLYQWKQLEFDFSNEAEREHSIHSGDFIPGKPAPIDVDIYYAENKQDNKVFVTIPRFQEGVPVTLGTVTDRNKDGNPIIAPYPSWDWHLNPRSCNDERIVSVYRVKIDECNRLWVLDTGHLVNSQICPAQILAFDLNTNQLVHKHEIPQNLLEPKSLLVTPMVDVRDPGTCQDTFVYMADCQDFSIVVHDVAHGLSWKAKDKTMYPYPSYGTYSIQGDSFDLMDGILGMALAPYHPGKDRKLFYHAMSSPTENWVYTSHLRNHTRFIEDPSSSPNVFHTYRGERRTQSAAEATDKNGIMYFGLMTDTKIACWNTRGEYADRMTTDTVAYDTEKLQFASGIKVVKNKKRVEELWILTSRFQKIGSGTLDPSEVNFRIQAGKIEDILFGTRCKKSGQNGGGYGLIKN